MHPLKWRGQSKNMECAGKQTFCISSVHASSSVQWSCSLCIAGQAMCYMIESHPIVYLLLILVPHPLANPHPYKHHFSPHYSVLLLTKAAWPKHPVQCPLSATICRLLCDQVSHVMTRIYAHNTHTGVIQLQKSASSKHSQVNEVLKCSITTITWWNWKNDFEQQDWITIPLLVNEL